MADVKRLQIRRDTAANWASVNPMLLEGEIGLILGGKSLKIGDGVNSWSQLPTLSLLEDADREKLSEIILFYEGTDTDDTINKWKELEAFLAGQTETSTLAELLSVKADRTELEQVVSDMGQMDARLSGLIGTKQDAISDLGTIRSNAANGNTAYGWGDHSKAGYAMASSLTATQEEVRVQGLTIDELRESIAGKAGQSSVEQIVASIEELDEFVGNLTTDDVDEGSRKYFTEDLARAAVSEMLTALDTRISQNESNIQDHENKITANTTNLNTTIQRVAANEASIERIDGYCDVFNADIGDLKVTVKGHSTSIEALQTSSAEHSSLLQSLQNGLTTTNATVAKHSEDITALAEAVEELSESWITSTDDLDEGSTNLYFTNARAKEALASELANKLDKKLSSGMKVVATDASGNIVAHYVTTTQLGYLANVTSDLQAQIDAISAPDLSGYLTSDSTLSSAKLDKNSITIAETPVSLGGSISTKTLASKLGLSNFLTGITSSMVTTALGYTPYNAANFTKANIKSTLGISEWALASSKPTYTAAEVGALPLSGGTINGTLYVDGASASIELKEGAIKSNLSGTDSWSIDDSGNGVFNSLKVGSSNVALASDLSGYLPLSGGTINSGTNIPLIIQSPSTGAYSMIDYYIGTVRMGSMGFTKENTPSVRYTDGTFHTLIHSGNISSYAVTSGTLDDFPRLNGTSPSGASATGTWGISISGNATSATKLATARTIWGQSFDGTGNVSGNLSMAGTISGCSRISNASSGSLYLGNSDNTSWVLTQDICSHSGTSAWAINAAGKTFFTQLNVGYTYPSGGTYAANINGDIFTSGALHLRSGSITLSYGSSALQVTTTHGVSYFGMMNASYCHIYTDAPAFYFNKSDIYVVGDYRVYHTGNLSPLTTTNYSNYALPISGGTMTGKLIATAGGSGSTSISYANAALLIGTVNRTNNGNDYYPGIAFSHMYTYNSGTTYRNHAHAWIGLRLYDTPTAERSYLIFATNGDSTTGTSPVERMCISPLGNVGIGTTNPNTKLHVAGDTKIEGALSSYGITATTSATTDAVLTHYVGSTKQWWVSSYNNCANFSTALYVQSGSSPYKVATMNDLGSYLPKTGGTISGSLTFSSTSGSHIIGNASNVLQLLPGTNGTVLPLKIAKLSSVGQGDFSVYCDESQAYNLGTSSYPYYYVYSIYCSASSDATKKNIIGNIPLTTSQIANAPAVSFTWKDSGEKSHGTIAQYWKEILPEFVSGEEGSYGLNYAALGVVSAIILARNIETHEQRIARLEKEISDLQKELNALVNNE